MEFSNKIVLKNLVWRYAERMLAQIIAFIVTLVLARLLTPSDYGTVALITVVVAILEVFSTRGYNQALVQKAIVDDEDYSTVFWVNMGINILLYIIVWLSAPYVAIFYNNSELSVLLRVLSIRFVVSGFNSIQQAYVQRNMMFKKFFYSTLIGTLLSGIIGITIAVLGGGAWAIVAQNLSNAIIDTSVLFFTIEWKPQLRFSKRKLKEMSSFGIKMFAMGILDAVYENVRSLLIGKRYTAEDLAFYNKGQQLPNMVITNTQVAASNVFFSALSREKKHVKDKMRTYLSMMFFLLCPIMIGLAVASNDIINVVFSEKWIPSSIYMKIYCISYLCWIPQMPILQALNSQNKAGVTLWLSILHRTIGVFLLFFVFSKGPLWIAISALVADGFITVVCYIIGSIYFKYSFFEIISDIFKPIVSTLFMCLGIIVVDGIISNLIIRLIMKILIAVGIYVFSALVLKDKNLMAMLNAVRGAKLWKK